MNLPPNLQKQVNGREKLGPHPGPQKDFCGSVADIVIYGGSAGSGKSYALLYEAARYAVEKRGFDAVLFRRLTTQLTQSGGLWPRAGEIYPRLGGKPRQSPKLEYRWPDGGTVRFDHLQYTNTRHNWQGSEIALIGFDELTHFDQEQFWYLASRNRSLSGARPYIRATTNPDADSWVAELIAWWIDPETGFPIPERSGVLRYFVRVNDKLLWADRARDLRQHLDAVRAMLPPGAPDPRPKSLTFISAKITDNPTLLRINPEYLVDLHSQPTVERERLLSGNWKIRPAAGLYFNRTWCQFVDAVPAGLRKVRYWDLAGTPKTDQNDPDWTVGVLLGLDDAGFIYILDVVRDRCDPFGVQMMMANTASADTVRVKIGFGLDPGQAGKAQAASIIRNTLPGYNVIGQPETGDKATRFGPFSAQARAGNVRILRAPWNDTFLRSLEGFPELPHDDDADACSGAFEMLAELFHKNATTYFG